jgi:hypothetical protein
MDTFVNHFQLRPDTLADDVRLYTMFPMKMPVHRSPTLVNVVAISAG